MSSVSSIGSITSPGIGSGLDVNTIVTKLMSIESQPLTLLQQKDQTLNSQISSFGQLKSLASAMTDAAGKLSQTSTWQQNTATSSDSSSLSVSADGTAVAGNYTVSVQSLAQVQTVSSTAVSSSASTLGTGTLTIQLGTYTGGTPPTGFTPGSASAVNIPIGAGSNSLASIRDAINAANAGVTASIVTDANGARLAIQSTATGAANAFKISVASNGDTGDSGNSLSVLGFDATAPSSSTMTLNQTAANASATINGIAVSSASNSITGAVSGVTLSLAKVTSSPVAVTVSSDKTSMTNAVNAFVNAYNSLNSFIHTQTAYNASTKTGGPMQGDSTVNGVLYQLRGVINQASTASSAFTQLSDVGITIQQDGSLAVDNTKLQAGLSNLPELQKLFAATGTGAAEGFMARFRDVGNSLLDPTNGSITSRINGLQSTLKDNAQQEADMQTRLDATQARLLAQYNALDTQMASLNSQSNYVTNFIAGLNKKS